MVDSYGRTIEYLRLSVTDRCNLSCLYCRGREDGAAGKGRTFSDPERIRTVSAAAALGISKVRITGGEPLLHDDLPGLCDAISRIPGISDLSLTTNGILLAECAKDLVKSGVGRINISLDTLRADRYAKITRNGRLSDVKAGIDAALLAGFSKVKINVVLIRGLNEDEIADFADLTRKDPLDVRFIELMPGGGNAFSFPDAFLGAETVPETLPDLRLVKTDGVAEIYSLPGAAGRIGLIHPVSGPFCERCNRLRITADGSLRPCLHNAFEIPLCGLSEEAMKEAILRACEGKPKWHGGLCGSGMPGRTMNEIGG